MDLVQLYELVPHTAHQATLDAERPDQMDAFGAFPPVINHARNNLDFALRRVLPTILDRSIARLSSIRTHKVWSPPNCGVPEIQSLYLRACLTKHRWDANNYHPIRCEGCDSGDCRGSPR